MEQFGRLRIKDLLDQGEVQTYAADDPQRSVPVLLHLLPMENERNHDFLERVDRGLKRAGDLILERGREGGVEYVLTERFSPHRSFLDWLEDPRRTLMTPPAPSKVNPDLAKMGRWEVPKFAPPPAVARAEPVSSVSGLFQIGSDEEFDPLLDTQAIDLGATAAMPYAGPADAVPEAEAPGPAAQPVEQPAEQPPKAESKKVDHSPGDFTRMFQTPAAGSAREPSALEEPGSFTRLFQSPAPPDISSAPPRGQLSASDKAAGEFTRMFQAPIAPQTGGFKTPAIPEKQAPPVEEAPRPPDLRQDPGEFTRMFTAGPPAARQPEPQIPPPQEDPRAFEKHFEGPLSAANAKDFDFDKLKDNPVAAPPPPPKPAGEFTQMFGKPFASDTPRTPQAPRAMDGATRVFQTPQKGPGPAWSGGQSPGEYTRMFANPSSSGAPASPSKPVAAPTKIRKAGPVLIVTLAVLFILAVGLILFFALRH